MEAEILFEGIPNKSPSSPPEIPSPQLDINNLVIWKPHIRWITLRKHVHNLISYALEFWQLNWKAGVMKYAPNKICPVNMSICIIVNC